MAHARSASLSAAAVPRRPYPDGWFAVARAADVGGGRPLRVQLAGQDLISYRTRDGDAVTAGAYCPHLGAHLGHGGRVQGDIVICPFHGLGFNPAGECVRAPAGTTPPRAQLDLHPTIERNGLIFVWRHSAGRPPAWDIPVADLAGYGRPVVFRRILTGHPQEIVENSVDIGHFGPLHHYSGSRVREGMVTNGHKMTIRPAATRSTPLLGATEIIFDVEAHGLGYILAKARIARPRARAVFQLMATPLDRSTVDARFSVTVGMDSLSSTAVASKLSWWMTRVLAPLFWSDIRRDFPIWENKVYLDRPHLSAGDGPILPFRRWAAQFYSEHPSGDAIDPTQGRVQASSRF